jgi:pimeloyl-ACP methyl ester carboxylesterase
VQRIAPYPQAPAAFRAQLAAAVDAPPRGGAGIMARTLVLCGRCDRLIAPAASRDSFADVPGVASLELEDAAHSLHWDQPAAFVAAIDRFLAGQ